VGSTGGVAAVIKAGFQPDFEPNAYEGPTSGTVKKIDYTTNAPSDGSYRPVGTMTLTFNGALRAPRLHFMSLAEALTADPELPNDYGVRLVRLTLSGATTMTQRAGFTGKRCQRER
jgi:hypothetical protein